MSVQLGLNLKLTRKFTFVVCKVKINVIVGFQASGSKIIFWKNENLLFSIKPNLMKQGFNFEGSIFLKKIIQVENFF